FSGPEEIRNVEQSIFRGGSFSLCFKSFNPPASARNWANAYVLETKNGKLVHHSTYRTTPVAWLGPKFIAEAEHLKDTKLTAYRHEYLGEVVGSGTAVFENIKDTAITDEQIAAFDRVLNGLDWGYYPDPWTFNRMHFDAGRRVLYIFAELEAKRAGNRTTADMLTATGITGEDIITADSAEPKSISDYNGYGLRCRGAEKGPGSVEYSMKWLQSLDAIVIDPARCPATYKEFAEYEYERDKAGVVLSGYPDINNHHIDAVRYGTEKIWKRRGR
ncbi:MAG: terminase large subunit, partial [Angelakisella sp.]